MTIPEKILIAEISQYLSSNAINKSGLYGDGEDLLLPRKLYSVRKNVQWMYDTDPTNDTIEGTSNMMLALCGKYRFAALAKQNAGGSVAPINPDGASVNNLDFIVSASSIIPTGGTSIYFDGSGGRPDFRGMNVNFARGGTTMYTTNPADGSVYYGWNKVTGLFQLLGTDSEALEGERFRIMPDTGTAGSSSGSTGDVTTITVTGSDFEPDGVTLENAFVGDATEVMLFVSGYSSEWLFDPAFFTKSSTGLVITAPGFDANNFTRIIIQKIN